MLKILLFVGTARTGNYTQHVAHFVEEIASQNSDLQIDLVSPESLQLKFVGEGEQAKEKYPELTRLVTEADGYIIVSPEYNHGYSGSLKYLLDLHLKEYIHKPVAFVGVSSHIFGGSRVIEALLSVVRELGMVATFNDVNFGNVQKEIIEGEIQDKDAWSRRVTRMLDELIWMARTLKAGRTQEGN